MAKTVNLTDADVKSLKSIGITSVKTEDEARKKLLAYLKKNEIEDVEDEPLKDLIEMAEAFYDGDAEAEEDETEEEEVPAPKKKAAPAPVAKKKAVVVEEDEEEDMEELAKESKKKVAAAPVKKAVAKKEVASDKVAFDPKTNDADAKVLHKAFGKHFPKGEFEYKFLAGGGVTIFHVGKNSKKAVVSFDNIKSRASELTGNLYLNSASRIAHDEIPCDSDLHFAWSKTSFVKNVKISEVDEILTDELVTFLMSKVAKLDVKLGKNRDKMEANLKGDKTPAKKVVAKKVVEDEVEEDEVDETPVAKKKVVAPVAKKKAVVVEEDEEEEDEAPVVKKKVVAKKK